MFLIICLVYNISNAQTPKLYITLVSHNEDNIGYNTNSISYYNNRVKLVNICNILQTKGVKYNYGSDYSALQAIAVLDTGLIILSTNGKNLVKWMKEDKGVECDPHSHESLYNYADIHYLMSQLGITPSNTMSGYLYDALQNGNAWDSYQNGVTGLFYPSYTWHPQAMWGGATSGHVNDPHFFGVFKPQSMNNYFVHDSLNTLITIGAGCPIKLENTTTVGYVDSIIDNIVSNLQTSVWPANGIYTQAIFFNEGKVNQPWFMPLLNKVIDSVNVHVVNGTVEWKNLSDIVNIWQTSFGSAPYAFGCDSNIILDIVEKRSINDELLIYPNPFSLQTILQSEHVLQNATLTVYNCFGQAVKQINNISGQEIILHRDNLSSGVYFIQLRQANKETVIKKLIVTDLHE